MSISDPDPLGGGMPDLVEGDNKIRRFNDPQSMRGVTEDEFVELAESSGLKVVPMPKTAATGGRGWRAFNPDDKSINAFWEAGDPTSRSADVVHRGPYMKWQWRGTKEGYRVPADGNPDPTSGDTGKVPPEVEGWKMPGSVEIPDVPEIPDIPIE